MYQTVAAARLLLDHGADPDFEPNEGDCSANPLSIAVRKGREDMVELLLKSGATIIGTVGLMSSNCYLRRLKT